jgi:hypothetical protein
MVFKKDGLFKATSERLTPEQIKQGTGQDIRDVPRIYGL